MIIIMINVNGFIFVNIFVGTMFVSIIFAGTTYTNNIQYIK